MSLTVSFRQNIVPLEFAITLFGVAFHQEDFDQAVNARETEVSFSFKEDVYLNELRAWLSDAYGCGLITRPHIECCF